MYQIITDIADLQQDWLNQHPEVAIASPIVLVTGDGEHHEYYESLVSPDGFMEIDALVRKGGTISSSMPVIRGEGITPPSAEEIARKALDEGRDVLYLAVNSTISGAYGAVYPLFEELKEEYPDRKLICMDSECASTGLNMLIKDLIDSGITDVTEAENYVKEHRAEIGHLFSWQELLYIFKSGKVNGMVALIGKMLHLKPFCSCEYDEEGVRHLTTIGINIRTEQRLAETMARYIKATILDENGVITVNHGNTPEFAEKIATAIRGQLPNATVLCGPEYRCHITIQAHGGPTSVHINYHRKKNELNTMAEAKKLYSNLFN